MLFHNSRSSNEDSKNYLFKFIRILKKIFHKERKSKNILYSMNPDILNCIDAQNGLTESEERLKEVLENQISCSYKRNLITDNYEYFSPVFIKITGYSSEEMKKFTISEVLGLIHPDDIAGIESVMKESMSNPVESAYYVEYRFKNKNGSYRWLHDQFTVLKNKEGVNAALIGSLSDIDERKQTENMLHETLLNLKKSQSIASIGNWKLDISTNKFNSSEEGLRLFGFPSDFNPTFQEVSDYIHPDDLHIASTALNKSLLTGEPYSIEIRVKRKDTGEIRNILSVAEVQFDINRKPLCVIGVNQDITELKRKENTLRQNDQRYKDLIENSGTSIIIIDRDGFYKLVNRKASEQFGTSADRIIGKSMFDFLPHDTAEKYLESNRLLIDSGGHREYEDEYFLNGKLKTFLVVDQCLKDEDGNNFAIQSSSIDISIRKEMEKALIDNEARLRAILDNSRDAIGVYVNGIWEMCNPAAVKLFGVQSLSDLLGTSILNVIVPDERERILEYVQKRLEDIDPPKAYLTRGLKADGTEFEMEVTLSSYMLYDVKYVLVILRDITERILAEKALQHTQMFLNNIIEKSPNSLWISDEHGTLIRMNQACRDKLHLKDEEVVGKYNLFQDNILEAQGFLPLVKNVFEKGTVARFEISYDTSAVKILELEENSKLILDVNISPIVDSNGKVVNAIIQHVDITERAKAIKALHDRDILFRKLSANVPGMIFQYMKRRDGTFCVPFATEAIKQLYNCSPQEVKDDFTPIANVILPEELGTIFSLVEYSAEHLTSFKCEYRVQIPGENIKWLSSQSTPEKLEDGSIIWHGYNADITEGKLAEEAIKLSEKKFRSIIESSPIAYALNDDDGNITYLNSSFVKTFGYNSDDLKTIADWWPKAYPDLEYREHIIQSWQNNLDKAKLEGSAFEPMEVLIHCKDDTIKTVIVSASSITDQFAGIHLVILYDITERKQAEEEIHKKTEELENYFSNALDLFCIANMDGYFLKLNKEWENLLGYSLEELQGIKFLDLVHPDDLHKTLEAISKLSNQNQVLNFTNRYKAKDGSYKLIEWRSTPQGNLIYAAARDITEHKLALDALIESENKYHQLFENMQEGFALHEIITDEFGEAEDFRFIDCNKAYEKHTGFRREDVLGRTMLEVLPTADKNRIMEYGHVVLTGEPLSFEYYSKSFNRHLHIRAFRHSPGRFATIFEDITERKDFQLSLQKNYEREHELNEMKNKFISMVSHEFRTPLTSILASSDFLEMGGEKYDMEKKAKQFARIRRSVDYMLNMLNEVLMINKMDREKIDVTFEIINLSEFCREVFVEVNQLYPKIKSKIEINLKDGTYNIDTILLKNILGNLISNAFKYNVEKGNVKFSVEEKNDRLIFRITDTGFGIPADEQNKLFEPFSRMSNVRHIKGTGLGMSIIKNSVELLNGEITFVSIENEETEFIVTIPIVE